MGITLEAKLILLPMCAQVLLTFLVWTVMYITRIGMIFKKKAPIQKLANEAYSQELLKDVVNPSDNLENLFELPVLFYAAVLMIYVTNTNDQLYLNLAWAFVIFRSLHSLVHCTSNTIRFRFLAYMLSSFALWIIWARATFQLL